MKKVSILAAAIAVALTGCGSDSSNSGVTTPTRTINNNQQIYRCCC